MVDIDSTLAVSIKDEIDGYDAKVNSSGEQLVISKITDGTYTADVTSTNRLKTETNISAVPATAVEYKTVNLLNGASAEQTVNGATTPVEFTYTPGSGEIWFVEEVSFTISDGGAPAENTYGALAALTNGTTLVIKSNGTTTTLSTMKNNMDILMTFADGLWDPSSYMSVKLLKGSIVFHNAFTVQNSTSDYIKVIVNDDLTGLNYQRCRIKLWRETP